MAITIRLKHWQTALSHHGASLLSCLQTQTPFRSLCSLLSPTNSEEDQKRRQNEEQKEMFRMNYKVDATTHDTRQPFKPSVFFYIGNQGHEASVGDLIYTERLKYVNVNDKVEFTKVGLVSLKRKLFLRHPLKLLLQNAYVKAVVEAHVQEFGKDLTKLRVVDFGFLDDEGRKKKPQVLREAEVRACVGAELRRQRQMLLILNIAALLTPLVILMYSIFLFHVNYVSFPAY